jgi:hypothetical protein
VWKHQLEKIINNCRSCEREREGERECHSRMFRVNVLAEQASRFMMEEDMKGG